MLNHFKDLQKMQEVLRTAQTGLWIMEFENDKAPRLFADRGMLELLGFDEEPAPEECYRVWYERIDDAYYPVIQGAVEKIIMDERAEVQYPWEHPKWGRIYVRCGGVRDESFQNGVCLRGYHQNITNTVMLKQEYDTVVKTLSETYTAIFLCNLLDGSFKIIKRPAFYQEELQEGDDYRKLLKEYVESQVAPQYREMLTRLEDRSWIQERLAQGERRIEVFYRNREDSWRRIKIVPASGFSKEYQWMIGAFDEQDGEMERRLDDASSKVAVAQIYELVISVDLQKSEYNCIYYSGNNLTLGRHGPFQEFASQMREKMYPEDHGKLETIFDKNRYLYQDYMEGTFRLVGERGDFHYYSFYSACIDQGMEKRILMTARNIDDKQSAKMRDDVLSNLCKCYYSIYLLNLENETVEPVWQEDYLQKDQLLSKGALSTFYQKFVQDFVYEADRDKMLKVGSPAFLRQVLTNSKSVYDIDFRRIYPEGLKWVRSRFCVAKIQDGRLLEVVFANMNIHAQKLEEIEQEEKNRNALLAAYETAKEANEAKSNFLAQMSHDIRTPMNAIMGMTTIAEASVEDPVKVRDCLDKIEMSSRHLLSLINEVLDMSKIEKGKIELLEEAFSLVGLLDEVASIIKPEAERRKLRVSFEKNGLTHPCVLGDRGRLSQVLLNLVGNAVKYTLDGGSIRVAVQEISASHPGHGNFVFVVEDSGIGMKKEFLDYIFIPFSRAEDSRVNHIQGTGLGMSIAQGIIAAMGGNIQVESEIGKGSRFTVSLSLKLAVQSCDAADKTGKTLDWKERAGESKAKGKLILAEDNELNMDIAQTILEQAGYTIDGAENGREAVEQFENSPPGTYQAILMDLQMPVMDGYLAAQKIRESRHPQGKSIPIIALTANTFAEDIAKALAAGMNDHVAKPIDFSLLFELLEKYR